MLRNQRAKMDLTNSIEDLKCFLKFENRKRQSKTAQFLTVNHPVASSSLARGAIKYPMWELVNNWFPHFVFGSDPDNLTIHNLTIYT